VYQFYKITAISDMKSRKHITTLCRYTVACMDVCVCVCVSF